MDQRANIIEQDIKDIVNTRVEISRKMQLIDEQARYELENMKTKWSGLAATVGDTGKEFMDRSARMLNPVQQMSVRPWVVLGGVVLLGYAVGMLGKRGRKVYPYYPPQAHAAPVMPSEEKRGKHQTEPGVYPYFPAKDRQDRQAMQERGNKVSFMEELWREVKGNLRTEMQHSKEAVEYALRQFARDMAKEVVPTILKSMRSSSRGSY